MSITSSAWEASTQADGSRNVVETHTDSAGGTHTIVWTAPSGMDVQARVSARVAELGVLLAEAEFERLINGG